MILPAGVSTGQRLRATVRTAGGEERTIEVVVPPGKGAGDTLRVKLPPRQLPSAAEEGEPPDKRRRVGASVVVKQEAV